MDDQTIAWYDAHAAQYAGQTMHLDMSALRARFLAHLPPASRVLDVGCGSGRDAVQFQALGHRVTAIDASRGLVQEALSRGVLDVRHMKMEELAFIEEFQGIWASASLLHLTDAEWPGVVEGLARALVPGGVLFITIKHTPSYRDDLGRYFSGSTPEILRARLQHPALEILDLWDTPSVRPVDMSWLNILVRRRTGT